MSTPFPNVFNIQNAEKSILDVIGFKEAYLGNTFSLISSFTLASSAEVTGLYIINPSTASKGLFFQARKVTGTDITLSKCYFNPTVSNNGSSANQYNLRPAYTTASIATCYTGPTASNNGTLIDLLYAPANGVSASTGLIVIIDPGNSLLINVSSANASSGSHVTAVLEAVWYEI